MGGCLNIAGVGLCLVMVMCIIGMIAGNDEEDPLPNGMSRFPPPRPTDGNPQSNSPPSGPSTRPQDGPSTKKVGEEKCRQDLRCWGDKHSVAASVRCSDIVESYAQYDHKWTDSWYETKFGQFVWADKKTGKIRYHGNKVKFQRN